MPTAMPTDLQKKDELRRELMMLELVLSQLAADGYSSENLAYQLLATRISDIKKALED